MVDRRRFGAEGADAQVTEIGRPLGVLRGSADDGLHDHQVVEHGLVPHHAVAIDVAAIGAVHSVDDAG